LGPYEIISTIGAGGMGEVYRARDTRLDRTVAIKVLPEHLSSNPQLRERFDREAKAISSLSHPHICALHDVGHQDGVDFLVMEFLEGETLAHRLKKGPLPADQVLQYAIQITDALDTAHRHGVVHRDLKPGNIMLVKTGAKLLDFGLAKVRAAEAAAGMTALPTQTTPLTGEGTILGTLQYMAPEQLEGAEADVRTDIFALGAAIYEMATGRKAFAGKSHASLISAIMTAEPPPISALQTMAPPALDHVVRTCLAKDPEARWQTAHDVLVELKWIAQAGSQAGVSGPLVARRKSRELISWTLLAVVSLFAVTLSIVHFRQRPPEAHAVWFQVPLPEKMTMDWFDVPVVSPDGQRLVLPGVAADGARHLWLRSLDSLTERLLPGTEGADSPFWSPDSRSIAFFAADKLKRLDAAGGSPATLCDVRDSRTGDWNSDGVLLLSTASGLLRVSAVGGDPAPALPLDKSRLETNQIEPQFLPDGRHFVYLSRSASPGKSGLYLGSLDSKATWMLLPTESNASYVSPGYLIYGRQQTLLAQPFDASKLRFTGEAVPVAEHVGRMLFLPVSQFSASQNGVLVYSGSGLREVQLAWHDRNGSRKAPVGEPGIYEEPSLSPDEKKLVLARTDPATGKVEIWILELSTGIYTRVTFHSFAGVARWSRNGRELLINKNPNGHMDLYRKEIGGGDEELVFQSDKDKFAPQWLADDSALFITDSAFYRLALSGVRQPILLLKSEFYIDTPVVTLDGRWVAYQSTESGRWEIHVAAFPSFKQRRQVSNGGGCAPHWRRDGKELFYLSLDGKMMSVDVKGESSLETSSPRALFQTALRVDPSANQYEVTGDGKRFLFGEAVAENKELVTVVLNWNAGLKH
jgi:Tol biopolymer transport system component